MGMKDSEEEMKSSGPFYPCRIRGRRPKLSLSALIGAAILSSNRWVSMERESQRGQILPLVAFSALVLVGVAGLAVDVGYHQYQQRMQQTATDAAAIAGAKESLMGHGPAAAKQDARVNGFADNTGGSCPANPSVGTVCIYAGAPQSGDAFNGVSGAFEVDITVYHPTFFEKVFNINKVPVTTKAVAVLINQPSHNCLYVLNGGANFNGQTGGGTVNAHNCGLAFNGPANFHAATVDAEAIDCADGVSTCSGGTYLQATPQPAAPASDPCSSISYCAYLANSPPPCTTPVNVKFTSGPAILTPGCYGNINVSNASKITFGCGLYVITGTLNADNTNGSSNNNPPPPAIPITQDCGTAGPGGTTFYLSGSGQLKFINDVVQLSAPTSGDYNEWNSGAGEQNVLVYQDPSDTQTLNFQSANSNCGLASCDSYFSGMIYAPSATLNYNQFSSTSTGAVLIVSGALNANGGVNSIFNAPGGPPGYPVLIPVLGE
jgi:hypothetical protein